MTNTETSVTPELIEQSYIRTNLHDAKRWLGTTLSVGALMLSSSFLVANKAEADVVPSSEVTTTIDPETLASDTQTLVYETAEAWQNHQSANGLFIDPVANRSGGYGTSMIGQVMVETGFLNNNTGLLQSGINAELASGAVKKLGNNSNLLGDAGFDRFSLSSAYIWNQANLSTNPSWQSARDTIAGYLESNKADPISGSYAVHCYINPNCYNNLKLVTAYSDIELADTGIGESGQAVEAGSGHGVLSKQANKFLHKASRNIIRTRAAGLGSELEGAGLLSDPQGEPLAYHELSTMLLGHVIESLGSDNTPKYIETAFQRAAKAIIGIMAPNGDGAYIGRGQGQVWNVAAEADALSLAARFTSDPVWRDRFLTCASIAINRLETVYIPGQWGFPLVPRLKGASKINYSGVDPYADSIVYNGLAEWALSDAAVQLQAMGSDPIPAQDMNRSMVFTAPSQFATVRKGNLWWAIHAADASNDARYDFGLVAAEQDKNGEWSTALPYRPLTNTETSGGPELIYDGKTFVPKGSIVSAQPNGVVEVKGGWSSSPENKPTLYTGTTWRFSPTGDGVKMAFRAQRNGDYRFQVWYDNGSKVSRDGNGIHVIEPDGQELNYTFNRHVEIRPAGVYNSAYEANLKSFVITVNAKANEDISYVTSF